MADYPNITTLAQLNSTPGLNYPDDNEAANKLDDSIRQLKNFVHTFLSQAHADDGTLKSGASTVTSITDASITYAKIQNVSATDKLLGRSTAGAGVVEEIACTAFGRSLLDDADAAAGRTTLGLGAMATKATVATADLDNDAVDATKLKDDVSTSANRAVTSNHIQDGAVTADRIAASAVTVAKLNVSGSDAAPKIPVGASGGVKEAAIGGALTATFNASSNTLEFSLGGSGEDAAFARLEEKKAEGTSAGGSTAGSNNTRGGWTEYDPSDFIGVTGNVVTFRKKGNYFIDAVVPGYSCGSHRAYLYKTNGTPATALEGVLGCSSPGNMSHSRLIGILTVAADNDTFEIRQWVENTVANNGLGLAASSGVQELYSIVNILKLT